MHPISASSQENSLSGYLSDQIGFTLLELIITVLIISILSAVAIPSYRAQVRLNSEEQVRSRMLAISLDLSRYRSKALSYKGYVPLNEKCSSNKTRCYSEDNGSIYVPLGSDSSNYKYVIVLQDNGIAKRLDENDAIGRSWTMTATPNSNNSILETADTYNMTNTGVRTATAHDNTVSPW